MHATLMVRLRWKVAPMVVIALASALLGCRSTSLKEVTFSDQPSAGSVHIAAQSIAPFDEYIDSLQPRFELTSAQALDQAMPLTSLREAQELRSLAATLKAALPRLQASADGSLSETPAETGALSAPPGAPLPTLAPLGLPGSDMLQADPTLRYHAAASLFQEVSLLSNYVRDAAVNRGQVPYIVRLLVTSLPNARTSPYDFYATVSFFEDADPNGSFAVHGPTSWDQWKRKYPRTDACLTSKENEAWKLKCDVTETRMTAEEKKQKREKCEAAKAAEEWRLKCEGRAACMTAGESEALASQCDTREAGMTAEQKSDWNRKTAEQKDEWQRQCEADSNRKWRTECEADRMPVVRVADDLLSKPCGSEVVSAVPLFATESYETSLLSSAFASSQSLGLSLGGSVGTVGLDAAGQAAAENRERALVRSVNQPFSVARIAENTLQMRLGAVFSGTKSGFVTPSRSYNLTALVLVRRGEPPETFLDLAPCPTVRFRAHTEVRQVGHGRPLDRPSLTSLGEAQLTRDLLAKFPSASRRDGDARRAARKITSALLEQNYQDFLTGTSGLDKGVREDIWLHAQELMAAWGVSVGRLRVPDRLFYFFSNDAKATLVDDGKSAVLKVTDWYSYVPANGLSARLVVNGAAFPADKPSVSADGQTAIATFPSVKSICAPAQAGESHPCDIEAELSWRKPVFRWGNLQMTRFHSLFKRNASLAVRFVQEEKSLSLPKPQLTVPAGRVVLTAPDAATVTVIVRPARSTPKTKEEKPVLMPVALSVSGAEIVGVAGVQPPSRFWTVSSDAMLVLQLRNVIAGATIRIQAATLTTAGEIDEGATVFQDLVVVTPSLSTSSKKE